MEDEKIVIAIDNPYDLQKVGEIKSLFAGKSLYFNVALKKDILDFIKLFTRKEKELASMEEIISQLESEEGERIETQPEEHRQSLQKTRQSLQETQGQSQPAEDDFKRVTVAPYFPEVFLG